MAKRCVARSLPASNCEACVRCSGVPPSNPSSNKRERLPCVIWSTSSCCCLLGLCGRKALISVVKLLRATTATAASKPSSHNSTALLRPIIAHDICLTPFFEYRFKYRSSCPCLCRYLASSGSTTMTERSPSACRYSMRVS